MRRAVLLIATLACWSGSAVATPLLSISSASIATDEVGIVDIDISGLGDGTALGGFDVNVGFAPTTVSYQSVTFGDPTLGDQLNLEGYGTVEDVTAGSGSVELYELSFDSLSALISLQATSFRLATLDFVGLSSGTSQLSLSVNSLADQGGNSLLASLQNGSVTVGSASGSVPEPSATSLLVAGVAALMLRGLGRRRSRLIRGNS